MAKLWQFSQGHPKPTFSKTVERGNQGKFFKNRPKNIPRLKGPKARWLKSDYPLISIHLNCRLEKILAQTAAPKVPEWPSYGNFRKITQNTHFLKKCKGGTKGNSFENRPKNIPRFKGPKARRLKCNCPLISMHLICKYWRRFRRKQWVQKCLNGQVMTIFARSPKTHIF